MTKNKLITEITLNAKSAGKIESHDIDSVVESLSKLTKSELTEIYKTESK